MAKHSKRIEEFQFCFKQCAEKMGDVFRTIYNLKLADAEEKNAHFDWVEYGHNNSTAGTRTLILSNYVKAKLERTKMSSKLAESLWIYHAYGCPYYDYNDEY